MKINYIIAAVMLFTAGYLNGGRAYARPVMSPYYSFSLNQGAGLPSKSDFFFTTTLNSDIGLIGRISDYHRLLGFYGMRYTGPGLQRQEGRTFLERTMDHLFVVQHQWTLLPDTLFLKTSGDFMREYLRTGANEVWGEGLYDFLRYGGKMTLETRKGLIPGAIEFFEVQCHYLDFPNYSDLLLEFQLGEESAETSQGSQNNYQYQAAVGVKAYGASLKVLGSFLDYTAQKVINREGTFDATGQRDLFVRVNAEGAYDVMDRVAVRPSARYKNKTSNQNYLYFPTSLASIDETEFFARYFDYNQMELASGLAWRFAERRELIFTPQWEMRMYMHRNPRNSEGEFLRGTRQVDHNIMLSAAYAIIINEFSRYTLYYGYYIGSSNNKYERYMPYNYHGHTFGFGVNLSF